MRGGGIRHPARELSRPAPLAQTEQEHATLGRLGGTRVRCGGTCVAPAEAENVAATSPTATQMTSAFRPTKGVPVGGLNRYQSLRAPLPTAQRARPGSS